VCARRVRHPVQKRANPLRRPIFRTDSPVDWVAPRHAVKTSPIARQARDSVFSVSVPRKLVSDVISRGAAKLEELKRSVNRPMYHASLGHMQAVDSKKQIILAVRVVCLMLVVPLVACPYREDKR